MEDFLVLLLQGLFELILEIILSGPVYFWDNPSADFNRAPWSSSKIPLSAGSLEPKHYDTPGWNCLWLFLLGGLMGGFSLCLFDHTFITVSFLRMANLIYAPVTSGFLASFIALLRDQMHPRQRFFYAFFFTFGLTLIRFTYAHH